MEYTLKCVFIVNTLYSIGSVVQMQCDFFQGMSKKVNHKQVDQKPENTDAVLINEKGAVGRKRKIKSMNNITHVAKSL
jgi:hypothetical protein